MFLCVVVCNVREIYPKPLIIPTLQSRGKVVCILEQKNKYKYPYQLR